MTGMTIAELSALLAGNGLPAVTPVTIRVLDGSGDSQHSTGYAINRVQVVRQLVPPRLMGAGQSPEFVLEIVAVKPPSPPGARPSAPYPAVPDQSR
jgi:hypothetical protein